MKRVTLYTLPDGAVITTDEIRTAINNALGTDGRMHTRTVRVASIEEYQKLIALEEKVLYLRVDAEDDERVIADDYLTKQNIIDDANRFYQEHFDGDDYDENFEVKDFAQALDFWEANGYEIFEAKSLNYKAAEGDQ